MNILVTITSAGANTGPFNIYGNADNYATPLASNVAKSALQVGYTLNNVSDSITSIRIYSTGTCNNYIDLPVNVNSNTSNNSGDTPSNTYYDIFLFQSSNSVDICSGPAVEAGLFYIDTPALNFASKIYTDMYGNEPASAGYYSEGIEGYRYWDGSTLGPQISCPTGGGGGCFVAGTEIILPDNTVKLIEDLQVGDQLTSYNIKGLPLYSDNQTVLSTWNTLDIQGDYTIATVTNIKPFNTGKIININELLQTTPNHRHLVKVGDVWSFIEAKDVKVGDILRNYNNEEVVVETVSEELGNFTAYTLDVEDIDLFYANGILTHNYKEETLPQDF